MRWKKHQTNNLFIRNYMNLPFFRVALLPLKISLQILKGFQKFKKIEKKDDPKKNVWENKFS